MTIIFLNRPEKLAPDACPKAKNRKRFDPAKSGALSVLLDHEKGTYFPGPSGPPLEDLPASQSIEDKPAGPSA